MSPLNSLKELFAKICSNKSFIFSAAELYSATPSLLSQLVYISFMYAFPLSIKKM